MQVTILKKFIFDDIHVLNAALYLHEGLKKIANTKNISKRFHKNKFPDSRIGFQGYS